MPEGATSPAGDSGVRSPGYLRLLIAVLGTATFFEGFDTAISAVALEDLARSFHIPVTRTGNIAGPIIPVGLGALGALVITMLGDRVGRRPLLIGTTFAYAVFTGLTATSHSLAQFVVFQFFARSFLLAEYATAITMVSEEFPASKRGRALGLLTSLGAFGLPVVAVLHLLVKDTALGWRILYLVGLIPLVAVGFLRLKLKETDRWTASHQSESALNKHRIKQALALGSRANLLKVGGLYFFSTFALLGAVTWWPFYASVQLHFSPATITKLLGLGYTLGISGYYLAGRLADRFGRRRTGTVFLLLGMVFGILVFQIKDAGTMFPALIFAVFFGFGINPILAAVASELFPTNIRATAIGLVRSVFGTVGGILGPITVGVLADPRVARDFPWLPFRGKLGHAVIVAALMNVPAMFMLRSLPETANQELDEISA